MSLYFEPIKSSLAEACPGVEMGDTWSKGVPRYQGRGAYRAVACPDDDEGMQTACFKLNLAEACPGIDAGGVWGRYVSRCRCMGCVE